MLPILDGNSVSLRQILYVVIFVSGSRVPMLTLRTDVIAECVP